MGKKLIVFGSFLAVFLMLMVSVVNAIEYKQVENNLKEKMIPVEEQLEEKNIITSYDLADVEKSNEVISKIKNNPDSLCSSCGTNLLMRPKCKILLKQFWELA